MCKLLADTPLEFDPRVGMVLPSITGTVPCCCSAAPLAQLLHPINIQQQALSACICSLKCTILSVAQSLHEKVCLSSLQRFQSPRTRLVPLVILMGCHWNPCIDLNFTFLPHMAAASSNFFLPLQSPVSLRHVYSCSHRCQVIVYTCTAANKVRVAVGIGLEASNRINLRKQLSCYIYQLVPDVLEYNAGLSRPTGMQC